MRIVPLVASGASGRYQVSEKIIGLSTVYQRGKTQIPAQVRKGLDVKDGDKVIWVLKEGEYVLRNSSLL